MILQALCDYYERKPDLPRAGFELKGIPFVIEIDHAGKVVQIEDTRNVEGKKRIPRNFLVPQGEKKTSGIAANILWDNAEYVLGVTSRGKPDRVQEQCAAFQARLEELFFKIEDTGLKAVSLFFKTGDKTRLEADLLWPEILETNPVLTFRLNGDLELICQRPAVRAALEENKAPDTTQIRCLITGGADSFERLHTAIRGVRDAQTSGANIVSFNKDAFNSFGKEQGANAPVGKRAAFAYTTALNYLLSKESNQRIQVGDASTVFWSERHTELEDIFADLFDEPPKDDPTKQTRAVEALFKSPNTGAFSNCHGATHFYVLGLAPNAARISIRFWLIGTIADMSVHIRQHFDDLDITHANFEKPHLSLFRLLVSTAAQGKSENITPNLAGEFMRAILAGLPYPATLLQAVIRRIRAEQEVKYPRAALIKACLNRQIRYSRTQEKEITVSLDESNNNAGYRIGRLFAALEKVQEEAINPGATIRDRFYGAASSTPVTVFANLMKLKNHHLAKLEEGRKRFFEKLIGQIMSEITDFPQHLSLADQGRFAIGYYHQRQAFFTKSESTPSNNKGE
ncbi:type I-C CRISPR-associated protein Cas8c/Csd1 [Nitrosovibrio sp. Nv6]|uniref:type I-C CRISPR-associated protein Cas8c/Csd1 n=1 Tax=Nitrosovibrio sp. Nv6 TaxID=1855340 RepID=UPI0008B219F1|nr:type I-C CRISPR-associated protein Cas8c/Csd1 [Nitrosovibrio sp. Nv6]SEP18838.1 CRISPR-associated protein Csd1 [Nitrosovibrio sp. Nv6]